MARCVRAGRQVQTLVIRVVLILVLIAWIHPTGASGADIATDGEVGAGALASLCVAVNLGWLVVAGCAALLMKAGFALAETGLVRSKNAAQTAALVLGVFAVSILGFWACGFAWMFGGHGAFPTLGSGATELDGMVSAHWWGRTWDLLGARGFGLLGTIATTPALLALFFFHAILVDVAVTIPTGAMLERWRFAPALIFGFVAAAVIVPVYGGWVWGGGWLADLGATLGLGAGCVDFAGSGVLHLTGGVMALAGALALGASDRQDELRRFGQRDPRA